MQNIMSTPWKCLQVEIQYDTMHKTLSHLPISTFTVEQMSIWNILFTKIQTWYHAEHDVHSVEVSESGNTRSHHAYNVIPCTCINFDCGTTEYQEYIIYRYLNMVSCKT
jgi:hypothetical protein